MRLTVTFLCVLFAGACSNTESAKLCIDDADCPSGQVCRGNVCAPPGSIDAGPSRDGGTFVDAGIEDGGALDGGTDDGGALDAGLDAGRARAFGERCASHGECESQLCLETPRGGICTITCRGDCASDYVCKSYVLERDRIVNLCTPVADVYCVRCAASSECNEAGDRCTEVAGATYCTKDCSQSGACPPGFMCADVAHEATAEGRADAGSGDDAGVPDAGSAPTYRQCLPVSGKCPGCVDRDGDGYGVGADCLGPDCDDTNREVHPNATELCNDRDDNCDTRVDEGFDLTSDARHCGACGAACGDGQSCCARVCVDMRSSQQHCGACANACSGVAPACCDSTCRDLDSDVAACGACGLPPCTNAHGSTVCAGGECAPTCAPGFADCNGNRRDGCESALADVSVCGTCAADRDCPEGFYCDGTVCRKKRPTGEDCVVGLPPLAPGRECASGYCVDGVCCNRSCAGVCRSCDLPGTRGTCTFVSAGQDPDAECDAEPVATCGQDGTCDGFGSCRIFAAGTQCVAQSCGDGIQRNRRACDGQRNCVEASPPSTLCAPYGCDGASSCFTACANDTQCAAGYSCIAQVCRVSGGLACNGPADCASGNCIDGVCCNEPCNGLCERCNLPGFIGVCQAVPSGTDPDNECDEQGATSCGQTGVCSGTRGRCGLYAAGTTCLPSTCENGLHTRSRTCDGAGMCIAPAPSSIVCFPFVCDPTTRSCFTACRQDAECASGYACADQVCKKARGEVCVADAECASGYCTDGVCCDERCRGFCEKCNLTGRTGFCDAIPDGQDPENECPEEPLGTCGRTGVCNGLRGCALQHASTVCQGAFCIGNSSHAANRCSGFGECLEAPTRDCAPITCDVTTGLCRPTCAANQDCIAGYDCVAGTCKKSRGEACAADTECASGFCTDGVCCAERCHGVCEKCDQASRLGFCDAIAAGQDPEDECDPEGAASCGKNGVCSGERSCALYAAGTECLGASCANNVSTLAHTCDGQGNCVDRGIRACRPITCDTATGLCRVSCSTNGDCVAGYDCALGGVCKKSQGEACAADAECASGFCADQVCCESRCGGLCERCNLAGRAGACDPVPAGQDPDDECANDAASTCQKTGACDGARACAKHPEGTVCAAARCENNVSHAADTCDGQGACVDNGTTSCAPYACDPGNGLCRPSCNVTSDCAQGYDCAMGVCKKARGEPCGADADCASGFCTDQVCCDSRCHGVCEKCNQANRAGFCDAIPAGDDPNEECTAELASTCGTTGVCSGLRTCTLHPQGTVCVPASCSSTVSTLASTCNGQGTCVGNGQQSCSPLRCDSSTGLCRSACGVNDDCAPGFDCVAPVCKKSRGVACSVDTECASGFCQDGVCCAERCRGVCESCNLPSRAGFCDAVAPGEDPDNECVTDDASTCAKTGVCSGSRTCALHPANTVCAPPSCEPGNASRAANLCNGGGACIVGATTPCSPRTCDPSTGLCRSTCASNTECVTGYDCVDGVCKLSRGESCSADSQCASGFCTDLVCCQSRCDGVCEKCDVAGRAGFCDAVPAGQDPQNECEANVAVNGGVPACGQTGACSGTRSCQLQAAGIVCVNAFCAGNTSNHADTCDGTGHCIDNGTQDCFPLTCGASGVCSASCGPTAPCVTNYECVAGACKKSKGQPCSGGTECASGFCADNVCCDSQCNGVCEKCNLARDLGSCIAIQPALDGPDPDNECPTDPVSGCQRTGACDGARACALYSSGTVCTPAVCSGNVSVLADTCNGTGTCTDGSSQDCSPYLCTMATGLCSTACGTNADCINGYQCVMGVCKRSQGQGCTTDSECASGFCTDFVCCQSRCNGLCERCDQASRVGLCDPVPSDQDTDNECAPDSVATCQKNGFCSGNRTCQLYASGVICNQAFCTGDGNSSNRADTCTGTGACQDNGVQSCLPYKCNGANGLCLTQCATNNDCQAGYECSGNVCKKSLGGTCNNDSDCSSGFCADFVCCNARCDGTCEKCNQTNRVGQCDPIAAGQNPDNECQPPEAASTCGRTGLCSGSRSCQLYSSTTVCNGATCNGNTSFLADVCNGSGVCVDGGSQNCAPFICNSQTGLCRTSCGSNADCVTGYACASDGTCKKGLGLSCTTGGECASGICKDGVCCNGPCTGVCERCNLSGSAGTCTFTPLGQDFDSDCQPAQSAATCGRTGVCNGAGACQLHASGTVCNAAVCSADGNTSNFADTCNGSGVCLDGGSQPCAPYKCNSGTGLCRTACSIDSDCQTGFSCASGVCKRATGTTCNVDADCASTYCTDGVCCGTRCHGVCEKCSLSGQAGTCAAIPAGTDPDNECALDAQSSCQKTGWCSGLKSCQLYASGTQCVGPSCASTTSSNRPDLCNGAGMCIDQGVQSCIGYTCNSSTGLCRTTCASSADCAPNYTCIAPFCKKVTGQACGASSECASNACCSGFCRDLTNDVNHCGACGLACSLPNATPQCVGSTCTIASCNSGFSNCDGSQPTGCEVNHGAFANSCSTAEYVGSRCGDDSCGFLCPGSNWQELTRRSGTSSKWFRARSNECSDCCADVYARITLVVPSTVDYDLFVYSACGSLIASSEGGTGATEQLTIVASDDCTGGETGFNYWVEVRHYSGASCSAWTVIFDGTDC